MMGDLKSFLTDLGEEAHAWTADAVEALRAQHHSAALAAMRNLHDAGYHAARLTRLVGEAEHAATAKMHQDTVEHLTDYLVSGGDCDEAYALAFRACEPE